MMFGSLMQHDHFPEHMKFPDYHPGLRFNFTDVSKTALGEVKFR